jgi:predicted PurR-regulated permease PerM
LTDPSVWFIFGSVVIGLVFKRTGLTKRMAYKMLVVVGERTSMICLGSLVIIGLLTHIMAHTAVAATVFPLMWALLGTLSREREGWGSLTPLASPPYTEPHPEGPPMRQNDPSTPETPSPPSPAPGFPSGSDSSSSGREDPSLLQAPPSQVGRRVLLGFLAVTLAIILYLSFQILQPFMESFIMAAATASLSFPIYERITRKLGGRSNLGATVTVLLLVLVVVVPITIYSSVLSREAVNLTKGLNAATIQQYFNQAAEKILPDMFDIRTYLQNRFGPQGFFGSSYFEEAVNRIAGAANKLLQGFVTGVASALLNFVIFFLFLFFMLRDGKALGKELMDLSPFEEVSEREIFHHLTKTIRAILLGGVLVPIVQGILAMIGFAIFGMPSPVLWGSLLVVGAVIPIVGSTSIWIPATIYLALTGTTWQWVGQLLYCIFIISTSDNILKPLILREAANFHPLIAFVSVLGGLAAFGIFGFILGPIIASLFLSILGIYKHEVMRMPLKSREADS